MPGGLEKVHADGFAVLGSGLVATRGEVKRSEEYMKPISGEKMVYTLVKECHHCIVSYLQTELLWNVRVKILCGCSDASASH
jgi:hypothetical protein